MKKQVFCPSTVISPLQAGETMRVKMRGFAAFTKKELLESVRTYKLFILLAVFLLFGMMNPLFAKLMPKIVEAALPKGMEMSLAEPTAIDSWSQFYKNIPQMGLLVLVILFSPMLSGEFSKGTLINILTKGLPRKTVIVSKYLFSSLLWSASYWLCYGITFLYTSLLWTQESVSHIFPAALFLWAFGLLLLAVLIFAGVLCKSSYGCLLFTGGFVAVLFLLDLIPKVKKINPIKLASDNLMLLTNESVLSDWTWPMVSCFCIIMAGIWGGVILFNKRQI